MKRILLFLALFFPLFSQAVTLRMEGDRAWLSAEGVPLPKVLDLFAQRGVNVLVDPSVKMGRVTGNWENVKLDRLIDQLVGAHNYLLEWRVLDGPLGPLYQLASIRIYSGENMGAAKSIAPPHRLLDVVHTNGVSYLRGEILVAFDKGSTSKELNALLKKIGGTVIEVIDPPGIYRIKLNEGISVEQAQEIAKTQEGVKSTEPNYAFSRVERDPVSLSGPGENLQLHLQPGGNAIAVLDSGIDPQYAQLPFIRGTYNALDPAEPMNDPIGHGTLTAMIAAGAVTPLGAQPAQEATPVYAIRTFDENGYTSSEILMRALNYAAESGANIVSMSWGSDVDSAFMKSIMDYAAQKGMKLYAAAGNEPTGEPIFPAGYDSVIAVGGLAPDGSDWKDSNFGDFVEKKEPAFAEFAGKMYRGTSISCPVAAHQAAEKASSNF